MTTTNLTVGGTAKMPNTKAGKTFVLENVIDFSINTMAQNDIAQLLNIPAKTLVQAVQWEVERVEGAARNFAIGDGADDDGFITTTTANTLASGCSGLTLTEATPNTVTGYSNGKYYSAADTIDLKAVTSGGLTTGKIRIKAVCVELN